MRDHPQFVFYLCGFEATLELTHQGKFARRSFPVFRMWVCYRCSCIDMFGQAGVRALASYQFEKRAHCSYEMFSCVISVCTHGMDVRLHTKGHARALAMCDCTPRGTCTRDVRLHTKGHVHSRCPIAHQRAHALAMSDCPNKTKLDTEVWEAYPYGQKCCSLCPF